MNLPNNIRIPIEENMPFELRACRDKNGALECLKLRQAATKARAKKILTEEFPSVLARLRAVGWIQDNESVTGIHFEIADTAKSRFRAKPITAHPIRNGEKVTEHTIWFENTSGHTLKDLRRLQIIVLGKEHYQVTSPNGIYSVDLESYNGMGSCTCPDFTTRRSPTREAAKKVVKGQAIAIHQDCIHLKHIKFLLNRPFGEKTAIPVEKLGQVGIAG